MIDLEERLRRAADLLDDAAATAPLALAWHGDTDDPFGRPPRRRANVALRVAACLVGLVGLLGVAWAANRDGTAGAPAAQPTATTPAAFATSAPLDTRVAATAAATGVVPTTAPGQMLAPAATLPPFADVSASVPPTVVGTGPTDWYRLQPDLDVAWYSDATGTQSMLCFRSPAGQECRLDTFAPTAAGGGPVAVSSAGNQYLIVTLDPTDVVTVAFDDGQLASAPVEVDPQTSWRVARIAMPFGASWPVGVADFFLAPGGATATSAPATAPPTLPPATSAPSASTVPTVTTVP